MKFSKYLYFNAAILLTVVSTQQTLAMANNEHKAVYISGSIGAAHHPWKNGIGNFASAPFLNYKKNDNGGFVYGGVLGFQFHKNVAIEAGFYKLPEIKIAYNGQNYDFHTKDMHFALKGIWPVLNNFSVYGKTGLGVQLVSKNRLFNTLAQFKEGNHAGIMFGAGMEYLFSNNMTVNLDYTTYDGRMNKLLSETTFIPKSHLFLASVGYRFNV